MEKKYFEYSGKDNKAKVMSGIIGNALADFCEQDSEFEQAVSQSGKTFTECMDCVAADVGSSISDIDAVKKAVRFYFSTADVSCVMKINLSGNNGANQNSKSKEFTLDDLF